MKKILLVICALLCANMVMADPPTLSTEWFGAGKDYANAEDAERRSGIRGQRSTTPPISPATLLLLGLGGAAVGTKVVRNRRKE